MVDTVALDGQLRDVTLGPGGTTAYVADGTSGLRILDVTDPTTASVVGTVPTVSAFGIAINGTTAYVADGTSGLRIIDVTDPAPRQSAQLRRKCVGLLLMGRQHT